MDEAPESEIASLKFLKTLVTTLTTVMIVGFIVLIGLLVTRFGATPEPLALPKTIALPDGSAPVAFTQTAKWYAVVTDADQILIFDAATGDVLQTIIVETAD